MSNTAPMYSLGINAVYHDSSACLVKEGHVIAAAEEERFTGIKHGKRPVPFSAYELPFHAIDFCLKEAGIQMTDIDHVAYSYNPFLFLDGPLPEEAVPLPLKPVKNPNGLSSPWDPLFLTYILNAPSQLADGAPHHLKKRFRGIHRDGPFKWHFVDHHVAHAASAYLASPYDETAVLTLDGRGERATTTYNFAEGTRLHKLGEVQMPHSLGLLYERLTSHLGFLHSSDEYKVMALASYGRPTYRSLFKDMVQIHASGQYTVKPVALDHLLGPPRGRGEPFEKRHFDWAHSLQVVLEETVLDLAHYLFRETKADNLCLAGGVALNCVMNARLRERGPFKKIWVQPAAGDAGTSLGAALWVDKENRPASQRSYRMKHAYLGPSYADDEIEAFLKKIKVSYKSMENPAEEVAALLVQDQVIGWFQGRMEFGPRALGSRSILASPLKAEMQSRLNEIKDREDFRPVAPVVLEEEASEWFEKTEVSPFMLFVFDVREEKMEFIPAVCHIDRTARIQTVNREQNPLLHDLLKRFQEKTGVPVLINTSFNTRGKPIVCSPRDALESFFTSPLDALVMGRFLVEKITLTIKTPSQNQNGRGAHTAQSAQR